MGYNICNSTPLSYRYFNSLPSMLTTKNINSIRFIAMFGVLFIHSAGSYLKFFVSKENTFGVFSFLISIMKFSTIVFFLISGYLFELNKNKYVDFKTFLIGKYSNLLKPYLTIFLIPICLFFFFSHPDFHEATFKTVINWYVKTIFDQIFLTNYWFIPVLVLYFMVNFFVPYRALKILFPISIAITLFYSINLYFNFVRTEHTLSFLGFLSFFFLGRLQAYKKYKPVKFYCKIILAFLFLFLSLAETNVLHYYFHSQDAANTLKISNILFSISIVVLLKDMRQFPAKILKIDTYFIYLIHMHVLRITSLLLILLNFQLQSWSVYFVLIISFILLCLVVETIITRIRKIKLAKSNHIFLTSKS